MGREVAAVVVWNGACNRFKGALLRCMTLLQAKAQTNEVSWVQSRYTIEG